MDSVTFYVLSDWFLQFLFDPTRFSTGNTKTFRDCLITLRYYGTVTHLDTCTGRDTRTSPFGILPGLKYGDRIELLHMLFFHFSNVYGQT